MTSTDDFWNRIEIPFQEEDDEFQFVNPVVVARKFVKSVGEATTLGHSAEVLTEQLANLRVKLERKERELKALRRDVLAKHYKEITKSAGSEVQEAFIRNKTEEDGRLPELISIEGEMETLRREIEAREPRLELFKTRMKILETVMIWSKQYLDYEKLVTRTQAN